MNNLVGLGGTVLTDHPGLGEEGGWLRISPPCVETVVVRSRVRALRGDLGLFLCLYPANPVGGQISPQIRNTCREMSHKHRHSKHTERYRLSRPQTCVQMNDICSRYTHNTSPSAQGPEFERQAGLTLLSPLLQKQPPLGNRTSGIRMQNV